MRLFSIILSFCLMGCSLGTPRDVGNANRIMLEPVSAYRCKGHIQEGLTIAYPQVPDALNTYRIALTDSDDRTDYFAGMRWADFLPDTIQSVLLESVQRSKYFDSVITDHVSNANHWRLETDVRQFQAVYHTGMATPAIQIHVIFRLRNIVQPARTKTSMVNKTLYAAGADAKAISQAFRTNFIAVQQNAFRQLLCNDINKTQ